MQPAFDTLIKINYSRDSENGV